MSVEPVLEQPEPRVIREQLEDLVRADLHGPLDGPEEECREANSPVDAYLLGRLSPRGTEIDPETQDSPGEGPIAASDDEESEPNAPSGPSLQPSAVGFSATVAGDVRELIVTAKWGRYDRAKSEREDSVGETIWRRQQRGGKVRITLAEGRLGNQSPDPEYPKIVIRGRARRYNGDWIISLFLENQQPTTPSGRGTVPAWIFQVSLSATGSGDDPVFLAHSAPAFDQLSADASEVRRLAMAYRQHPDFAVGSGAAVHVDGVDWVRRRARTISTNCVPRYEVPSTVVPDPKFDPDVPELELGMHRLAVLADGDDGGEELTRVLSPLVEGYRSWIQQQLASIDDPEAGLAEFVTEATDAVRTAEGTADRIAAGIETLAGDALARRAFGFANRAMYEQRLHTQVAAARRVEPERTLAEVTAEIDRETSQRWRPFQLAFVLLNLPSLADPSHHERSEGQDQAVADLLWFPTGGGKTEAYLGLTAFTIAIRRLQPAESSPDTRSGIAVLMRYTLRLLTIQQFERATTLICAAELLRRDDPHQWGAEPIRGGLWVGGGVSPNSTEDSEKWLKAVRANRPTRGMASPHQLSSCPWCGRPLNAGQAVEVDKTYARTLVICRDPDCPFGHAAALTAARKLERSQWGLPILTVDEEIYRDPPALLIGTVDKFAQLSWLGPTRTLFGRVDRRCGRHGYRTEDLHCREGDVQFHRGDREVPPAWVRDVSPVRPPDLIIQDELHLIAGPLGTLVGLYETAVDKLASWQDPVTGRMIRPKVVASTATVRRAGQQIGDLFHRRTEIFPPPGLNAGDSFFARQRSTEIEPGRCYVGICAHGARLKSTLIRVYVSVLGAAQLLHERYGRNEITDPYMTVVGYFNSLRDLGGMRRMVEDEVSSRLHWAKQRRLANRRGVQLEELTSRLRSDQIRPLLDRLGVPFPKRRGQSGPGPLDVLLATNMIAVGMDVSRLGLMVVANQPKSTSEYIQATSRVGRDTAHGPGIIFTVYNWARPRDLSYYEHFENFHATLYQHVEALSVTPFADRAIDRGLTGVLVALVRGLDPKHNGNRTAGSFDGTSELADHLYRYLQGRAGEARRDVAQALDARLKAWAKPRTGAKLVYKQPRGSQDQEGLLRKPSVGPWELLTCPTSLRDVEPSIQLLLRSQESDVDEAPPYEPVVVSGGNG